MTSCNISRSSVRSATIFFSRPFSSSSCFNHLGRQQAGILFLPVEVGCLADAYLAADLGKRRALFALLDDERLLRVRKLRCLHVSPLLSQPGNLNGKLQLQVVQFAEIRSSRLQNKPERAVPSSGLVALGLMRSGSFHVRIKPCGKCLRIGFPKSNGIVGQRQHPIAVPQRARFAVEHAASCTADLSPKQDLRDTGAGISATCAFGIQSKSSEFLFRLQDIDRNGAILGSRHEGRKTGNGTLHQRHPSVRNMADRLGAQNSRAVCQAGHCFDTSLILHARARRASRRRGKDRTHVHRNHAPLSGPF